jgi:ABC-type uncharacterized transport system involved in gliding motility auxiliary subunit
MNKKILSGTGLLIIIAIVLALNLIGAMLFQRVKLDMTQEKLFTLSKGSQKIIGSVEDPIRAEFYYSKTAMSDVPALKTYGDRVYDMLREYQGLSKGKLTLEVLDPRPDTEVEESAQKYGLQGVPVQQGGERLFLGLVLKSERGTE